MLKTMYLAGVGGQGLQVVGKTIVEAAYRKGLYVTYSPKYGFEKRGGLTSCYVVLSDRPIGNPRKKLQDLILTMEPKAFNNFKQDVKPDGTLVVNSTLVKNSDKLPVRRLDVPFHDICLELGNTKVISSVALGALAVLLNDVFPEPEELLDEMLEKLKKKPELAELNRKAFASGFDSMQSAVKAAG